MSEKRIPLPRRAILGGLLFAIALGGASALGQMGAVYVPQSEDFAFTRGTSFARGEENRLKAYVDPLVMDERVAFRVTGHTGTQGNDSANMALSENRAKIGEDILRVMGVPSERILWVGGVAGGAPLEKMDNESEREYERRLSRVTIQAVAVQ